MFPKIVLLVVAIFIKVAWGVTNITLGGLFSVHDEHYDIDNNQVQYLASFLMAIDEINNKTDGILDDILPNHHINVIVRNAEGHALGAAEAVDSLIKSDVYGISNSMHAVVNTLHNLNALLTGQILTDAQVIQAVVKADDSDLGFGDTYPYRLSLMSLESFQGLVYQEIMCNFFEYDRVVIFSEMSTFGQMAAHELDDGTFCHIDVLDTIIFPSGIDDFSPYIAAAKLLDASVFVFFCGAADGALLIDQGYHLGLFNRHVQLFGSEKMVNAGLWDNMEEGSHPDTVLHGFVGIELWHGYYLDTSRGSSFIDRWRQQEYTNGSVGTCHGGKDATGVALYQTSGGNCMGLNFSAFGLDHHGGYAPDVLAVYDAVWAIALGYHHGIDSGNFTVSDVGSNVSLLHNALLDHVEFHGYSGDVNFETGIEDFGHYGKGSRRTGVHFKINNFHPEIFEVTPADAFATIGNWSLPSNVNVSGTYFCGHENRSDCFELVTNALPGDDFVSSHPPYSFATYPTVVKVGLLMPPLFDPVTGESNLMAKETLAAVLLGIDELNNKTDGIWDDLTPSVQYVLAVETATSAYDAQLVAQNLVLRSFGGSSVNAVIMALDNAMSLSAANMLTSANILQIGIFGQTSELGVGETYPYQVQLAPIDSYQGIVWEEIICDYFHYDKVVVITIGNNYGTQAVAAMLNDHFCHITVLHEITLSLSHSSFREDLRLAKVAGGRVFVMFSDIHIAARVIEQGYEVGLFFENTQILLSAEYHMTGDAFIQSFSAEADVARLLKGVMMIDYWPDAHIGEPHGQNFMTRWRHQADTETLNSNNVTECTSALDDTDKFYYFHEALAVGQSFEDAKCAGLHFESYAQDGSTMLPYTGLAYDAVHMLAYTIEDHLSTRGDADDVSADALANASIHGVYFEGATGDVSISAGDAKNGHYGRGKREVGFMYRVLQFEVDVYETNTSTGFRHVGDWSGEHGLDICDVSDSSDCHQLVFNTASGTTFPTDQPAPIIIELGVGSQVVIVFLGLVVIIVSCFFCAFVYIYRKNKLIKTSQPEMLYIVNVGCFLAGVRVIVGASPISDGTCIAGLWLGHLAFWLVFATLCLKSWRIHRIINNKTLIRVKITVHDILKRFVVVIALVVLYLIVLTVVAEPHESYIKETVSNQATHHVTCSSHITEFELVLYIMEAVCVVYGAELSYATKNVPGALNESKSIAQSITVMGMLSALVFPLVFLFELDVTLKLTIAMIAMAFVALAITLLIFGPKAKSIFEGDEVDENMQIKKSSNSNSGGSLYNLICQWHPLSRKQVPSMTVAMLRI